MNEVEKLILKALQKELNCFDPKGDYAQWVMALAVRPEEESKYFARVLLKTSTSPYVDGTDIRVDVDLSGAFATLREEDLEAGPIYHGGPEKEGLLWLEELGKTCYLQQTNPFG